MGEIMQIIGGVFLAVVGFLAAIASIVVFSAWAAAWALGLKLEVLKDAGLDAELIKEIARVIGESL